MQENESGSEPIWKRFWSREGGGIVRNAASTLIAAGLIAIVSAIIVSFSRVSYSDSRAFRLLLAAVVVTTLIAVASLLIQFWNARNAAMVNRDLASKLESLDRHIPSIDWSFDAAEHGQNAYERIKRVIEDRRTMEFKVLTIFRDVQSEEVSIAQRRAIREYYRSLESALTQRPGFLYERLVVLRPAVGRRRPARDLLSALLLARPEFVEHSHSLLTSKGYALGARSDLRFYGDTGRLFDIGFAVALDAQRRPITLLSEIGTTRPGDGSARSEHPVLGLLALENPSPQLADAFLLDHQLLRTDNMVVDHVSDETVRDTLRHT